MKITSYKTEEFSHLEVHSHPGKRRGLSFSGSLQRFLERILAENVPKSPAEDH